jgi:glutamate--cysteine ligase regulatory subunit
MYAKEEKIDLLTHNDCTDILSCGTTRELLGPGEKGASILAARSDTSNEEQLAVVKNRGVIEKKRVFNCSSVGEFVLS